MNTTIIDGYVELLENLSASDKLDLISKLTTSVNTELTNKKSNDYPQFGLSSMTAVYL